MKKEKLIEFDCDKNEVKEITERKDEELQTFVHSTVKISLSQIIKKIRPELKKEMENYWKKRYVPGSDGWRLIDKFLDYLEEEYSKNENSKII